MANALKAAGIKVCRHSEMFEHGAADETWIPAAATMGYVIVTKDVATRTIQSQRDAIMSSNATMLLLRATDMKGSDIATLLIETYADVCRYVAKLRPPIILRLNRSGVTVEQGTRRGGHKK
jgi:hypothetical protein